MVSITGSSETRLLILASLFPPQKNGGGPPVSIWNLANALRDDIDLYVISKNHEVHSRVPLKGVGKGWKRDAIGHTYYTDWGKHDLVRMFKLIRAVKPSTIYVNSLFSADDFIPAFLYVLRAKGAVRLIVNPRGEFLPNAMRKSTSRKRLYVALLRAAKISNYVEWQVAADQEAERLMSQIGGRGVHVISNIPTYCSEACPIEKTHGALRMVYIARIHPHKNLDLVLRAIAMCSGSVSLDVYGPIEDLDYWRTCQRLMNSLPPNHSASYGGVLDRDQVGLTLNSHHVLALASRSEAFGHSIVESLGSGRPVLISDQTPWSGVEAMHCGRALSISDFTGYVTAIQNYVDLEQQPFDQMCESARDFARLNINTASTVRDYRELFRRSA